jgi:hypothetical protein
VACRRSHALLPDLALVRRLDVVTVIGTALELKVVDGLGLRPIAEQLDVPHTTLRSWWQGFRARSLTLLNVCTREEFAKRFDATNKTFRAPR